jgi:pyrroline-5-carboxylate reductase
LKHAAMPSLSHLLGTDGRLLLVGGGRMGLALLQGWLEDGLPKNAVTVQEPNPSAELLALGVKVDLSITSRNRVIVLAVKPQMADNILTQLKAVIGEDTLILSLMAGITLDKIRDLCAQPCSYVRTMPNTPAAIGAGITALFASEDIGHENRNIATSLMGAVGETLWVDDENSLDAVTALSGSGPAYVFHLVEAMANAGTGLGLTPDDAMRLARATVMGAGKMLDQQNDPVQILRQNVTSPGGTTEAALNVLMPADKGLSDLMRRAMQAAFDRAKELASSNR